MDFVLFGIQGSGKGTQAQMMVDHLKLAYFETGGALRKLAGEYSELGKKVKSIIEAGRLVPNVVVMEIIENFMDKLLPNENGVLFDGIPRQMEQALTFDALMEKRNRQFKCVLLDISREKAEERLITRRVCAKCRKVYPSSFRGDTCEALVGNALCDGELATRKDDNAEAIQTRLDVFEKETMPVIERYKEKGMMTIINGDQSIEAVTEELLGKI